MVRGGLRIMRDGCWSLRIVRDGCWSPAVAGSVLYKEKTQDGCSPLLPDLPVFKEHPIGLDVEASLCVVKGGRKAAP